MSAYYNMENEFGEGIAAFVAMRITRQIAQPKNLTTAGNAHEKNAVTNYHQYF